MNGDENKLVYVAKLTTYEMCDEEFNSFYDK